MNEFKAVIFDLDGTLLPMDTEAFMASYNKLIAVYFKDIIDPEVFVKALWASTMVTAQNLEHKSNYDVFRAEMSKHIEGDMDVLYDHIYKFYDEAFLSLSVHTKQSPEMIESVRLLKEKGYRILVATNPLFPMKANHTRLRWAGLEPEVFEYISCFEKNHYCKPHLAFYEEVLDLNHIMGEEALMVGNNAQEDLVAGELGMSTYLLDEYLIAKAGLLYQSDYRGDYKSFLSFVEGLATIK